MGYYGYGGKENGNYYNGVNKNGQNFKQQKSSESNGGNNDDKTGRSKNDG